jgi:preprotein translocase subunit SecY
VLYAFTRAFRTPDLRKKLLFTLAIMGLFRLGSHVPAPGVSPKAIAACSGGTSSAGLGLINLFSGGALLQLSVFALGIMPYITASIILQLLTVVIPRLETLKNEGQAGQQKITQYTRYLTLGLAVLQSTGLIATAQNAPSRLFGSTTCTGIIHAGIGIPGVTIMVITMTAGTGVIMWLGELITDRGVGNGMSLLIFTSIASGFPTSLWSIKQSSTVGGGWVVFLGVIAIGVVLVALVVFIEQGQRRIPVQYAKRMVGRRMYGGSSTYIPLKVNQAGVIPIIFAASLLQLPVLASQFADPNSTHGWARWINTNLTQGSVHNVSTFYLVAYFLLLLFFTFFYVAITFNPEEVADNMKKYGGFIPGIRAGKPTAEYLHFVLNRITWPGSLYLAIIAIIPMIALQTLNAGTKFPFGGTSILIIVGVGLDTVKQIESQLQQHNYEGFLR